MLYTGYGENYADNDIHDINIYGVHSRFPNMRYINTKCTMSPYPISYRKTKKAVYEFADTEGITVLN